MCSTSGTLRGRFKKPVDVTATTISGDDIDRVGRTITLTFVTSGATCVGTISSTLIACTFPMAQYDDVLDYLDAGKKIEVFGVGSPALNPTHWEI